MISDAELLIAALGRWPGARKEALEAALVGLGGVYGLARVGPARLGAVLPLAGQARLAAILELSKRAQRPPELPEAIQSPEDLVAHLGPRLVDLPIETFWVAILDARGRPKGFEQVARGTLTACLVHPREVFAPALAARAASIVVAHNHPSGDPEPSPEDLALTERLVKAGQILGVPMVDHVVIAARGHRSLGGIIGSSAHMAMDGGPVRR